MDSNNLERVRELVDNLLEQCWTLEEAIDWALEQLPIVSRDELIADCMADMGDGYE